MKINYLNPVRKSSLCIYILLFGGASVFAQNKKPENDDNDNANKLIISTAIGNNPYKIENSKGSNSSGTYLKPGIALAFHNGFEISAYTYALMGLSSHGLFEYDFTPEYSYDKGKAFSFDLSYTRYVFNSNSNIESSPLKNELYTGLNYNNFWIQPGLAFDFAFGNYVDSTGQQFFSSDVAAIFSVKHPFDVSPFLTGNGDLNLTPSIDLVSGTDKFIRSFGSTRFVNRIGGSSKIIKKKKSVGAAGVGGGNTKLYTESFTSNQAMFLPRVVEANIDIDYTIGKFGFEPEYSYDMGLAKGESNVSYFLATLSYAF
ncbi:MAG: hypothetical protein J0H55_13490 [Chitinophagaceae bacterium]|nr:hypothetical protein [Chitinophagaceae bacterium]